MKQSSSLSVVSVLLILIVTGCSKKTNTSIGANSPSDSYVQFIHASPNSTGLKPWFNERSLLELGRYLKSNTHYFPVPAGHNEIAIKQSSTGKLLNETKFDMVAQQYYSLFAADSFSQLIPVLIADRPLAPLTGKAQVRFINLLSNTQTVHISCSALSNPFVLPFKQAGEYQYVNPGAHLFSVANQNNQQALLPQINLWFDAQQVYTVFLTGDPEQTGRMGADATLMPNL